MNNFSLINWNRFWLWIFLLITSSTAVIVSEWFVLGSLYSLCVIGGIVIIWAVYYYLRVRVYQVLILFVVAGMGLVHAFLIFQIEVGLPLYGLIINMVVFLVLIPLFMPPILKCYELEMNAKKLFKMAADFNKEESTGYHDRPFIAGQAEYTNEEIIGFVRYLHGKRIAITDIQSDKVVISFSMRTSPITKPNQNDISYLTFDSIGIVMVYISRKDYNIYKNSRSIDQLCESMGKLFKRFLDYYQNGNEERFIAVFRSVRG
jgi:hypothetical protein